MSKEQFEQACENLYGKMEKDGIKGIVQYKPFFDDYWTQNPRIVICNYEAFTLDRSLLDDVKPWLLTYCEFWYWLNEKENKKKKKGKSKTVHFTTMFVCALLKLLKDPSTVFSKKEMKALFPDCKYLHQIMKNVMYMNIRPTWAKGNKQEKKPTNKIVRAYKNEIKEYIEALDADIFIVTMTDGAKLFNAIFNLEKGSLVFNKNIELNKTKVFSMKHFCIPNYQYWCDKAKEMADAWHNSQI